MYAATDRQGELIVERESAHLLQIDWWPVME
jgi:hypothetical protein